MLHKVPRIPVFRENWKLHIFKIKRALGGILSLEEATLGGMLPPQCSENPLNEVRVISERSSVGQSTESVESQILRCQISE